MIFFITWLTVFRSRLRMPKNLVKVIAKKISKNVYKSPMKKHEYRDLICDKEHNAEYQDYAICVHRLSSKIKPKILCVKLE